MLASVVLWFSSYNEVMTSDKFVYLFGRVIPGAVACFVHGPAVHSEVQGADADGFGGAGLYRTRYEKRKRIPPRWERRQNLLNHGHMVAPENAIETADSMRSRGYGLPGRTAFSIYRFDDRDKAALAWLVFCGAYLISGWMAGGTYFRYYPTVKAAAWTPMTVNFMLVYLALVLTPVILDRREDRLWNSLQSNI